ncbi:vitamin K epoxide reductase family protein [Hymenobacter aquaticus]|uniref:Vitamin K epoxide reductase family protein n=1 Tax=Hymenobacter aquaticus TaxID=1867101 RepID=A0A4Z0Q1X4_9BACT|nr:vitamin K epoxide reductase family protein [Hymenobacter aquaticus]TGE23987.1 vitamin K epoxide reductase family protein [Hymenobacter aquaticus]
MEKTVATFLSHIGAPVAEAHCERLIRTHSDFPALVSISDAFERLGLQHEMSMVDRAELDALPYPCLLHTEADGGDIVAIRKPGDVAANQEALAFWSGVIIQVDPQPVLAVQERIGAYKRQQFSRFLVMALALTGVLTTVYGGLRLAAQAPSAAVGAGMGGLLVLAAAGGAIGYFLLAKDLGIKYSSVENFCAVEGNAKTDCNRLLNSEGASILGVLKLSEAVFAYFTFQILALYAAVLSGVLYHEAQAVFLALSLLALPVIGYSVVYQYAIAKTWCKLCLLVDAVLLAQLGISVVLHQLQPVEATALAPVAVLGFALLLGAVLALTVLGKGLLKEYFTVIKSEAEALRVKGSVAVFKHLLQFTRRITITPFTDEIILGSPEAKLKLVLVLNLHCQPCKEHFQKVVDAIQVYPREIQIALRFVLSGRDADISPTSVHYLIRYWRENIQGQPEQTQRTVRLLQDWFEDMDLERFKQKRVVDFSVPDSHSEQLSLAHRQWILREHITRTPALFINGYFLPQNYTLDDILAMTQELIYSAGKEEVAG